jgi:hypothetical protein
VAANIDSLGRHRPADAFSLKIKDLQFLYNVASADGKRMDWTGLAGNAGDGFSIGLGGLALLDHNVDFKVAGSIFVSIENFVYVSGSVALQRKELNVKTVGSATPTRMSVLTIGASDLRAFVGIGDADIDDNDAVDDVAVLSQNAIGVSLAIDDLAIVLAKPVVTAGPPSTKSYFALSAGGSASLIGVDGVQISGRIAIEINKGKDTAAAPTALVPAIDFVASAIGDVAAYDFPLARGLKVATGPANDQFVIVNFAENNLLRVSGYISISVSEFFHVSGQFSFAQSGTPQTVAIAGGGSKQVNVMTIGASDVNAFVGIGGPYFVDSNGDGIINASDTPQSDGAMGFVLRNLDFALALFKPTNPGGRQEQLLRDPGERRGGSHRHRRHHDPRGYPRRAGQRRQEQRRRAAGARPEEQPELPGGRRPGRADRHRPEPGRQRAGALHQARFHRRRDPRLRLGDAHHRQLRLRERQLRIRQERRSADRGDRIGRGRGDQDGQRSDGGREQRQRLRRRGRSGQQPRWRVQPERRSGRQRRHRPGNYEPRIRPGAVQAGRARRPLQLLRAGRNRQRHCAGRRAGRDHRRQQPACRGQQRERADDGRCQPDRSRRRRSSTSRPRDPASAAADSRSARAAATASSSTPPPASSLPPATSPSASTSMPTARPKSASPPSSPSSSRSARARLPRRSSRSR